MVDIEQARIAVQTSVEDIEELPNGWRFTFNDTNLSEALQSFIDHEQSCCSFLNFEIIETPDTLQCQVTKQPEFPSDIRTVKEIIITLFST